DWILIIDADEKLEKTDVPILRQLLKSKDYNSIFFSVLSELPSGVSRNYSQRIFRRGTGHYEGIVHNQLICEGHSLATNLRIYHYGYNLDPDVMQKKFKRTETLLKNQIKEDPNYGFAWMNLVRIYKCQEDWDELIKTAEEAINTKRQFFDSNAYQMIMYDMAYALFSEGEYDRAEKACLEVLNLYPDNLDINFILGSIYISKKNYQSSIRSYKKYLQIRERWEKQPEWTNLIIDTFASQGQAWNNIGSAYAELGELDRAIDSYLNAISYKNDTIYFENLARIYLRQNRVEEAEKVIKEADELGIASDIMFSQIAEINYSRGNIDAAIEYTRKAIEKDGSKLKHHLNLGRLLAIKGNFDEARSIFENATYSNTEKVEILHNLAMINMRLNDKDKAKEYIDRIMEQTNNSANQYLSMGDDWVSIKEYETAIQFYERCLQKDHKNLSAIINLATCYAEMGKFESAILGYQSALSISPGDPLVIRNLLTMKKKIEDSIKD
ncbi:MAG: tetratricopeptide repeat protein, partial [Candidatus Poribacteria bacterium]